MVFDQTLLNYHSPPSCYKIGTMDTSEDASLNIRFEPPSPPRSVHDDFDHQSPYNITDFDHIYNTPLNPLTSPPFAVPHTPSYNGSFNGSPFSQHSELDFSGEDISFELLNGLSTMEKYEPSDYEGPSGGLGTGTNSLLMFTQDADYMSPHFSPDAHRSPLDHSSPSDNGDEQAPYTSDNHGHSRSPSAIAQSPPPQVQSHDVTQSFGNISIHTPNWGTQPLPSHSPHLPAQKSQSPPRLIMPEGVLDSAHPISQHQHSRSLSDTMPTSGPKINVPDQDGGDHHDGPSFHFVPATPVGGTGDERLGAPFQQTLTTLVQGGSYFNFFFWSVFVSCDRISKDQRYFAVFDFLVRFIYCNGPSNAS